MVPPSSLAIDLSEDQIDDLLYLSRVGDTSELLTALSEFKTAVQNAGATQATEEDILIAARDEQGNNVLHMAAANGHTDLINTLFTTHLTPPSPSSLTNKPQAHPLLQQQNQSGNTPLHWSSLNGHLSTVKMLVEKGQADPTVRNFAGRDSVFEAELAGHQGVVEWLLRSCEGLEEAVGIAGTEVGEGSGNGNGNGNGMGEAEEEEEEGEGAGEGREKAIVNGVSEMRLAEEEGGGGGGGQRERESGGGLSVNVRC